MRNLDINIIKEKVHTFKILSYEEMFYLFDFIFNLKVSQSEIYSIFNSLNTRDQINLPLTNLELKSIQDYLSQKLNTNLPIIDDTNDGLESQYYTIKSETLKDNLISLDLFISLLVSSYFTFNDLRSKFVIYNINDKQNNKESLNYMPDINFAQFISTNFTIQNIIDLQDTISLYPINNFVNISLNILRKYIPKYKLQEFILTDIPSIFNYYKDLLNSSDLNLIKINDSFLDNTASIYYFNDFAIKSNNIINSSNLTKLDFSIDKNINDLLILKELNKDYVLNNIIHPHIQYLIDYTSIILEKFINIDKVQLNIDLTNILLTNKLKEYVTTGTIILPIIL